MYIYLAALILTAAASCATLTFEGLPDGDPIADAYSGLDVVFTGGVALVDSDQGGSADMGAEPSGSTALYSEGAVMVNIEPGILGMTLYYSNPSSTTTIRMYSGADGHGAVISDVNLGRSLLNGAPDPTGSFSPFVFASMPVNQLARSILFLPRGPGGFFVDDLTLQFSDAAPIPEPTSFALLAAGAAAICVKLRRHERRRDDAS
jgi:hypothetical protein